MFVLVYTNCYTYYLYAGVELLVNPALLIYLTRIEFYE